jgi:hypothetical protein
MRNQTGRGSHFEAQLINTGDEYWRRKIARYQKIEVPKGYADGRVFYKEKTGCDFVGSVFSKNPFLDPMKVEIMKYIIPLSLYFEAKSGESKTLKILRPGEKNKKFGGIAYHQLQFLCEMEAMNAQSFILWNITGKINKTFQLSPNRIMQLGPGSSIPFDPMLTGILMAKEVSLIQGVWWDFLFSLT